MMETMRQRKLLAITFVLSGGAKWDRRGIHDSTTFSGLHV